MSSLKLEFLTTPIAYLRPVLQESRTVEETAETSLPEGTPDIREILHTQGQCYLRGRDMAEGSAVISVGVAAMVLCALDGREEPELVETYLPITVKLEHSAMKQGLLSSARAELVRIDSHMVGPRKVLVRATVKVSLCGWERCREEHPVQAETEHVFLRTEETAVKLLTAMGEKNYTVEDSVSLSAEEAAKTLLGYRCTIRHTEMRLTGTRAVLKGTAELSLLFQGASGSIRSGQATLPFSQYVDVGECMETDELHLYTCLTGAEVELEGNGETVHAALQLLTQAEVWEPKTLSCIADLYCLDGQTEPEYQETSYESVLDQQIFSPVGSSTLPDAHGTVLYAAPMAGETTFERNGETVNFTLPVHVNVLYRKEDGLCCGTARVELRFQTQAAQNCRFSVCIEELQADATETSEGIVVKATAQVRLYTYGDTVIREVTAAEMEPETSSKEQPGVIIRRTCPEETLWDLAKQYRTTQEAICSANGLDGGWTDNRLILIPRTI